MTIPLRSPCYQCKKRKSEDYPECRSYCESINSYLIALGDKPLVKTTVPKSLTNYRKEQNFKIELCTAAQVDEVIKYLSRYKKIHNVSNVRLGELIGVSPFLLNSIMRRNQKRMAVKSYRKIKDWMNRNPI